MKFAFAFLLVAFVAFQADGSIIKAEDFPVSTFENRDWWDDLLKPIKQAYEEISKLITKYINDPQASIKDLKEQLLKIVNDAVASAKDYYKDQANKLIGDLQKMVDCYKAEADKLQINIKDCYQKTQKEILDLPNDYLKNITVCGTNEYEAGMKIITSATQLADAAIKQYEHIPKAIDDCTKLSWWSATTCIAGVASECASLTVNIPQKIAPELNKYVNDIKLFVKGVPTRVQACALEKIIMLGEAATVVGLKFVNCVKDKFPDPTVCLPK